MRKLKMLWKRFFSSIICTKIDLEESNGMNVAIGDKYVLKALTKEQRSDLFSNVIVVDVLDDNLIKYQIIHFYDKSLTDRKFEELGINVLPIKKFLYLYEENC